jgi:hypothetical protein
MKHIATSIALGLGALFLNASAAVAQVGSDDGIRGHGEVVLDLQPELMRMKVDLRSKGKDLKEALASMKTRRAQAEKQLATLGAAKDSIRFGDAEPDRAQDQRQQQMERMLQQRMSQKRGKRGAGKGAVAAKPVKLRMNLTAEFPVAAPDRAELLVVSDKLQEAIKDADFGGAKETKEQSSEEDEELADEMGEMNFGFGQQEGSKPGEPSFLFVSKVSAAAREKGLADAFQQAKADASLLAKAAGIEPGALRSLGSAFTSEMDANNDYEAIRTSGFATFFHHQGTGADRGEEAFGLYPTTLKYKITVTASFALK